MKNRNTIFVLDLLGARIHTRESSNILIAAIKASTRDRISVDFSSVEYISRSFADQFYADKTDFLEKSQKTIVISNAGEGVLNMLQAVARTQKRTYRNTIKAPVYHFSSKKDFKHFLSQF